MLNMYYRISDPSDVRDLGDQIAAWTAAGNPKANDWAEQPAAPSADAVWTNGEWIAPSAPTFSAEAWVAQHLSPLQVAALSEFRFALVQAGKPLPQNMSALKGWLETMMAASVSAEERSDWPTPPQGVSFEKVVSEALASLSAG